MNKRKTMNLFNRKQVIKELKITARKLAKEEKRKPVNIPKPAPEPIEQHYFPTMTDIVVSEWFQNLKQFANGDAYELLKAWANSMIAEQGKDDFATAIVDGAENGYILTWETVYKTGEAQRYIGGIITYFPEAGVMYQEEVLDRVQFADKVLTSLEDGETYLPPL